MQSLARSSNKNKERLSILNLTKLISFIYPKIPAQSAAVVEYTDSAER